MAGTKNGVLVGKNADFTQVDGPNAQSSEANGLATNGQLWIGTTSVNAGGTHVNVGTLTSPNASVNIGYSSPNITIQAGGSTALTYTGDSGVAQPNANNLNIFGLSGSKTSATGSTVTVKSPPYSGQGSSTTVTLNSGSFVTAAVTLTLPVSAGLADGDLFEFVCTTAGALVIQAVGAQQIRVGTLISSAAGTVTSTAIGDSISLRFRAADGFFYATSVIGTWLIA